MTDDRDAAYVERMLKCAKWYRHTRPAACAVPDTFNSTQDAFTCMRDALLLEAHTSLQKQVSQPERYIFNAIDLDTDEPGIVQTRGNASNMEVTRGDSNVTPVTYDWIGTRREIDSSQSDGTDVIKAPRITDGTIRRVAEVSRRAQERSLLSQEKKAKRALMTNEEKRAERDAKRARDGEHSEANANSDVPPDIANARIDDNAECVTGSEGKLRKPKARATEEEVETTQRDPIDRLKPARKRGDAHIFESPASHDRHLVALMTCGPHPSIKDTLLSGTPSSCPGITIIQGPPGTGKSTALLDKLARLLDTDSCIRCLVCAPSNVSVVDLFRRAIDRGISGALCVAKEHLPAGTPRRKFADLQSAQVVFATVCGRSGPKLAHRIFDAVLVDEAAHCCEAHCWGLIRPDVRDLTLVGDVAQLPAQACAEGVALLHNRSLMERLMTIGVESTRLLVQHRMHPEILRFPNEHFYGGSLTTGPIASVDRDLVPYSVILSEGDEDAVYTSYENVEEAKRAVREAIKLTNQGLEVVLLTPYQAQVRRLLASGSGIPVLTVDASQGKEWDAVVLSCVRSSAQGFWSDERRLTVALTRAKHALRVIVNKTWNNSTTVLGDLLSDASARGCIDV